MIVFWLLALVMAGVAIGALMPFLWRQRRVGTGAAAGTRAVYRERLAELETEWERGNLSDTGFAEARDELEREVLADADRVAREKPRSAATSAPRVAIGVGLAVPVAAGMLYAVTGQPDLIGQSSAQQLSEREVQRYRQMEPAQRISSLEDYVESYPEAPRAWQLLGQAYRSQEQFGDAFSAFQRARDASNTADATLTARQAEALFLANGRNFSSSVKRLIDEALETDGRNPLALLLAGHAAMSEGRNEDAIGHWTTLREIMPDGDRRRQQVDRLLARARGEGGATDAAGAASEGPSGGGTSPSDGAAGVTVQVALDSELADRAAPDVPVFIFARPAEGGGPPLAVARSTVGALPTEVELSDAQSMMEGRSISQADRVIVTARVAKSGGVRPQPGDLQGQSAPVPVNAEARTQVRIDRVLSQDRANTASTSGGAEVDTRATEDANATEASAASGVTATVRVADDLRGAARPEMPVFVFADKPSGGGPPLAVARTTVADLPADVVLTDAQAMGSARKISQAERVVVTARASASGGVQPQPGDLEGQSEPVRVAPGVEVDVTIDRRIQ